MIKTAGVSFKPQRPQGHVNFFHSFIFSHKQAAITLRMIAVRKKKKYIYLPYNLEMIALAFSR
jgi:hypothetical protein